MYLKKVENIYDFTNFKLLENIFPVKSGYLKASPAYQASLDMGENVKLLYISSGSIIIQDNGKTFSLLQNDIFFFLPKTSYTLITYQEGVTEAWWIDIQGSSTKDFLEKLHINKENPVILGANNQTMYTEIKTIVTHYDILSSSDIFNIVGSFYKICAILMDEYTVNNWEIVPFNDKNMIYNGNWITWPKPNQKNQEEIYTADSKSFAEFNFYGTGIKWFGTMNFDCGIADIMIDQIYHTSVDCYNPTRLTRQLLFSNTKLEEANHIIKIFCTGQKNDKATNCDIVIDSLHYLSKNNQLDSFSKQPDSKTCKKAIEMIKMNYATNINAEQIADNLGISPTSLNTKFKTETGISIGNYIIHYRISKAKELLQFTDFSINEISQLVGYTDAFYFSRIFKKRENMNPSEFRKLSKG